MLVIIGIVYGFPHLFLQRVSGTDSMGRACLSAYASVREECSQITCDAEFCLGLSHCTSSASVHSVAFPRHSPSGTCITQTQRTNTHTHVHTQIHTGLNLQALLSECALVQTCVTYIKPCFPIWTRKKHNTAYYVRRLLMKLELVQFFYTQFISFAMML